MTRSVSFGKQLWWALIFTPPRIKNCSKENLCCILQIWSVLHFCNFRWWHTAIIFIHIIEMFQLLFSKISWHSLRELIESNLYSFRKKVNFAVLLGFFFNCKTPQGISIPVFLMLWLHVHWGQRDVWSDFEAKQPCWNRIWPLQQTKTPV